MIGISNVDGVAPIALLAEVSASGATARHSGLARSPRRETGQPAAAKGAIPPQIHLTSDNGAGGGTAVAVDIAALVGTP